MKLPQDDEALVRTFFEDWSRRLFRGVIGDRILMKSGNLVCLASPAIAALPPELQDGIPGMPIGTIEDSAFVPGLQSALLIARETTRGTVRVTEHAARLFLYSRDILGDSVEGADGVFEGELCVVMNPRSEALGFGMVVGKFKGGGPAVRAVHDLGAYLR